MSKENSNSFAILNVLMRTDGYLDTNQIIEMTGCDRKTVYRAIEIFEINGFGIEIIKEYRKPNKYRFTGLYGI